MHPSSPEPSPVNSTPESNNPGLIADYLLPATATVKQLKLVHGDRIYAESGTPALPASMCLTQNSSHRM